MESYKKEADIVVYNDDECLEPHILVECKKQDVSDAEFKQAIEQAYAYAFALPNNVKSQRTKIFRVASGRSRRVDSPFQASSQCLVGRRPTQPV